MPIYDFLPNNSACLYSIGYDQYNPYEEAL